jgi:hypothetical protein
VQTDRMESGQQLIEVFEITLYKTTDGIFGFFDKYDTSFVITKIGQ